MTRASALATKFICEVLEAGFGAEIVEDIGGGGAYDAATHKVIGVAPEVLHVEETREKDLHKFAVRIFVFWEGLGTQHFDEIRKVVAGVEGDPVDVLIKGHTRCDEQGAEVLWVDACRAVLLKVGAGFLQHLYRLFVVHVVFERELEVEGPCAGAALDVVGVAEQRLGLVAQF